MCIVENAQMHYMELTGNIVLCGSIFPSNFQLESIKASVVSFERSQSNSGMEAGKPTLLYPIPIIPHPRRQPTSRLRRRSLLV